MPMVLVDSKLPVAEVKVVEVRLMEAKEELSRRHSNGGRRSMVGVVSAIVWGEKELAASLLGAGTDR